MKKQSIAISLILCLVMIFTSCSKGSFQETDTTEPQTEEVAPVIEIDKSIAANDTDIGLNNQANSLLDENLSEDERLFLRYFRSGFDMWCNATQLQRYPDILAGTQVLIESGMTVEKVIESDGSSYQILCSEGCKTDREYYASLQGKTIDADELSYLYIHGVFQNYHIVPGDHVRVSGIFNGMKSLTVDGISYYVPDISVISYALYTGCGQMCEIKQSIYTPDEMKSLIRTLFSGMDVNVRKVNSSDNTDALGFDPYELEHYYVAELENAGDAGFGPFAFSDLQPQVFDLNSTWEIPRYFYLSADMQHYLITEINADMSTFKLSCYDNSGKKLWNREFSETTFENDQVTMDMTENHIYLVLNNKLYILDALTGEDSVTPKIVGKRTAVAKVGDGILLFNDDEESDGIVKTDLEGNVLWTKNINGQLIRIDENYLIMSSYFDEANRTWAKRYLTISPDGEILQDSSINR